MAKKLSTMQLVSLIVLGVTTVLAIVCLFIPFFGISPKVGDTVTFTVFGQGEVKLSEAMEMFDVSTTWATIAAIAAVVALIGCIAATALVCVKAFSEIKLNSLILMIVAIVTAVAGLLAIIAAFAFGGQFGKFEGTLNASPAVGAWLLTIGAIGNGVFAFLSK